MNSKPKSTYCVLILVLLLSAASAFSADAATVPERPHNYVTDLAGIVDNTAENQLNRYLKELEQKTTAQVAVLTINSLEGADLEDLSLTVAHDKWKLGQKGKDNGVLLLIAFKDRKYRIEVGYGLEGVLPDGLVGSIGRQFLVPNFKKGQFSKGIFEAVLAMAQTIAKDAGTQITGMPRQQSPGYEVKKTRSPTFLKTIVSVLFFIIIVILFIKNPRLFLLLLFMSSMGGRGSSWGSGGGGFGGGGGGFGGGGASGGW